MSNLDDTVFDVDENHYPFDDDDFDTQEVILWILNDEGLYHRTQHCRTPHELKDFMESYDCYVEFLVNFDNVNWDEVFSTRFDD